MPSVWSWATLVELLPHGGSALLGTPAHCGVHAGPGIVHVLICVCGPHVLLSCFT
jgi:hypothetical protein